MCPCCLSVHPSMCKHLSFCAIRPATVIFLWPFRSCPKESKAETDCSPKHMLLSVYSSAHPSSFKGTLVVVRSGAALPLQRSVQHRCLEKLRMLSDSTHLHTQHSGRTSFCLHALMTHSTHPDRLVVTPTKPPPPPGHLSSLYCASPQMHLLVLQENSLGQTGTLLHPQPWRQFRTLQLRRPSSAWLTKLPRKLHSTQSMMLVSFPFPTMIDRRDYNTAMPAPCEVPH